MIAVIMLLCAVIGYGISVPIRRMLLIKGII